MINCENPVLMSGAFPCGKCAACLSKRRRTWAHRIMLESLHHAGKSTFVTLTYAEDKIPKDAEGIPTLSTRDVRDWLKRLRKAVGKVRYFVVGEYGDVTSRPHLHAALWGLQECVGGPLQYVFQQGKKVGVQCQCKTCSVVRKTWGCGHVMVGTLSVKSAMYIAGYVVKNMTSSTDPRLHGRSPEFARMSLKPGIGALALQEIIAVCKKYNLPTPLGLRHGQVIMPLGRYLRGRIHKEVLDDKTAPLQENIKAVSILRAYAWANQEKPLEVLKQIMAKYPTQTPKQRVL